jgi:endonuclease/exonuclease/phosphatase family metal-dependent hydrolase
LVSPFLFGVLQLALLKGKQIMTAKNTCLTSVRWPSLLFAIFIFIGLSPTEEHTQKSDIDLRVLCYNVHHCQGMDNKTDIDRIASVILSQKPDVVFLQEIDNKTTRTGQVDQTKELERLTKLTTIFGKTIDYQGGEYGLAIMTRFPLLEKEVSFLPLTEDPEQRGVLRVVVEVSPTQKLVLLCTHLSHRGTPEKRVAQAQKINELFDKIETPAILAGDFNAEPDSEVFQAIAKKWVNATDNEQKTLGVPIPRSKVDYIFYRPDTTFSLVETKVIIEPVASDHHPVFSVLRLFGPENY